MTNLNNNQVQLQDQELDAVVGGSFWDDVAGVATAVGCGVAAVGLGAAAVAADVFTDGAAAALTPEEAEAETALVTTGLTAAGLM